MPEAYLQITFRQCTYTNSPQLKFSTKNLYYFPKLNYMTRDRWWKPDFKFALKLPKKVLMNPQPQLKAFPKPVQKTWKIVQHKQHKKSQETISQI